MVSAILPYELYSDSPGTLFNKHEWEEANTSHPESFDFGKLPAGWPTRLTGPRVWDGKDLQAHREPPRCVSPVC